MLTVKLILNEFFPENKGVWAENDFAKVQVVSLSNKNINEIDNLDLFDNITELSLTRNQITKIENIGHLMKLQSLDLTDNFIDDEGLLVERLPPKLTRLVLVGNPCVSSKTAMDKLRQDYPKLTVISSPKESLSPVPVSDVSRLETKPQNIESYMNSEDVLRLVVDRKCKLQALGNVNIDSTIQNLEQEYNVMISASRRRKENLHLNSSPSPAGDESAEVDLTTQHAPLYQSRLGELRASCGKQKYDNSSSDFFENLRAKSFKAYDEKIKDTKEVLEEKS